LEVGVFDPRTIEIWGGERLGMKSSGVFSTSLVSYSYKVNIFSNTPIGNVPSHLSVSFFVKEDDGVKVGLSSFVPYPSFTGVVGVLKVTSKGGCKTNGLGWGSRPSNGRLVLSELHQFVAIDAVVAHIWFSEV